MYEREIQQLRIEIKIIQKKMDKLKEEVELDFYLKQ